jgi:hypothetical protein
LPPSDDPEYDDDIVVLVRYLVTQHPVGIAREKLSGGTFLAERTNPRGKHPPPRPPLPLLPDVVEAVPAAAG